MGSGYGMATFQPGTCIKYANYAYLMLVGGSSFQTSGGPIVFTSQDDNFYGERLPNSTGNPTPMASPALSIYYTGQNHYVSNARFRWSRGGVSMSEAQGVIVADVVQNSRFEYSSVGINEYLPSGSLTLSGVTSMLVTTPLYVASGWCTGSVTTDYGVASNAPVNRKELDNDAPAGDPNKNSQSECSFVVVDSSRIVAAFFDTHLSEYGLGGLSDFTGITSPRSTGWSVSANGGTSFDDQGAVLPLPTTQTQGDAGDPVMARDVGNGRIYLLMNPSREQNHAAAFRLWVSTDNGQSFSLINTNIPSTANHADKPMIAVNNFPSSPNYHSVYVVGTVNLGGFTFAAMITCSSNGGTTWNAGTVLSGNYANGADICIRPNGTVYVFWFAKGPPHYLQYNWLVPGGSWQQVPVTLTAHSGRAALYSANDNGSGNPKRSNSAGSDDYFVSNAFPRVAVNSVQDRIYVVYPDLPSTSPGNDHGDIFIQEGVPAGDGSLSWSGEVKVNRDNTATDQWNPAITVNPAGTELFVGYYRRQDDSATNALIKAYGAKARLDNGSAGASFVLTNATFDAAPISTNGFEPLFAGTLPPDWYRFDPVWPQAGMYLDASASFCNSPGVLGNDTDLYVHFMADDYTWASSDGFYFYYAWCDRSEPFGSPKDANVRLSKVKQ